MGFVTRLLEGMVGKLHFYVFIGKNVAAEVIIEENKIITIDIKNPVLAIKAGIDSLLRDRKMDSLMMTKIKDLGYKVKIKYKTFEFEV